MSGRPLPGAVERPLGARFTADEFAEAVLGPSLPLVDVVAGRDRDEVPELVRLALEAAR